MRTAISGFFFIALFMGAVALAWLGLQQWMAAQASHSWPSLTGTLTYSAFEYSGSGSAATRRPVVRYSYTVDGETYTGDRTAFGPTPNDKGGEPVFSTRRSKEIKAFGAQAGGSAVTVFYQPDDPANAVLLQGSGLFLLIYLFCVALMLGMSFLCFLLMTGRIKA